MAVLTAALPSALLAVDEIGARLGSVSTVFVLSGLLLALALTVRMTLQESFANSSRRTRVLFGLLSCVLFIAGVLVLYLFREAEAPLTRMKGARDVAVVGFTGSAGTEDEQILDDVSRAFAASLGKALPDTATVRSYATETTLPLDMLKRPGGGELDQHGRQFVEETGAEILVGGIVAAAPGGQIDVRPAVYVRADQVPDAPELVGWYLSKPIAMDHGWQSARSREQVVDELVQRAQHLAAFIDALDAWHTGKSTSASQILGGLLPGNAGNDRSSPKKQRASASAPGSGFVTSDVVRLFRGHALEQQAAAASGATRQRLLKAARTDYRAVPSDSPVNLRAELSLAGNGYRLALGIKPSCRPGTVEAAALSKASRTLRRLADSAAFTELGRLKAKVNLAQLEQCRVTAGLVAEDGTVERLTTAVRAARGGGPVRELRSLAASIAAVHAAEQGELERASDLIEEALALQPRFLQRGLWKGLLASWELSRCDMAAARLARNESLRQLREAVRTEQADPALPEKYRLAFEQEVTAARTRCS
ncbi:hypothetical protein [Streptomyces sp. Je 1-369]|uniref:hypothetical protein n=1 Tax=Streptomyces sp. Je 1-369 TaxID=2966192 RepID=UPI002285FAF8|nr:hypothetical protein [Streptomyces sp. Je 1-369]WAL93536.1 hypothetical protein NOO62_02960 [Streptomyces sp. Je 1-369]